MFVGLLSKLDGVGFLLERPHALVPTGNVQGIKEDGTGSQKTKIDGDLRVFGTGQHAKTIRAKVRWAA